MPRDCLRIIESKLKVRNSRNKPVVSRVSTNTSFTNITQFPEVVALTDAVKDLLRQNKTPTPTFVKLLRIVVLLMVVRILTTIVLPPMATLLRINTASSLGLGSLPSNIIANPRGDLKAITTRGGVAYDRPMIPPTPLPKEVERETKVTKDKVQNTSLGSTTHVQPPVVQVPIPKPDVAPKPNPKPSIPYPSRLNKQKLHEKDDRLESCMALSDIGASIKLIPLSVWKKLSLPDLTSTRMTLELATRTFAHPARIAEDVFVQVGKFTFSADFVVVDYNVDPRVPLILGRPFLRMACALVNINMINFIEITCEDHFPKVLKFKKSNHPSSGSTTLFSDSSPSLTPFETSDSLLEEFTDELDFLDPIPLGKEDNNFDFEADLREAKFLLHQDPSSESNIETVDPILKKFTDEPALAYLPPSGDDDDDDDLFDLKSDNDG
nr:reverse transcriptase domain-containing protein [Tanacetum cinerariifolium]